MKQKITVRAHPQNGKPRPPTAKDILGTALNGPPKMERVDPRWAWHYARLLALRERLLGDRGERRAEALEPMEPHSMSMADSASDEIDHDVALAELSAEQDALYEIDEALKRIGNGTYGICQQSGGRIPAARLKAIPWARFTTEIEARLEASGQIGRVQLGALRSVRHQRQHGLGGDEEEEVESPSADETLQQVSIPSEKVLQRVDRPESKPKR